MSQLILPFPNASREVPIHIRFRQALDENEAAQVVFVAPPASRRLEIVRCIGHLKSAESIGRNVGRAIRFPLEQARVIGCDQP